MPEPILIVSNLPAAMTLRLERHYDVLDAGMSAPIEAFGRQQLSRVRALVTLGGPKLSESLLNDLPSLGAIVCYGTGYNGIDMDSVSSRRIVVGNSPGANATAVAELAMALMLAVTRRIVPSDRYVRAGGWAAARASPVAKLQSGLAGRRVGIYGLGEIGRKFAARAAAFETEVAYFSRRKMDVPYAYMHSLAALVEWCDILIISVRAGNDTHHAIGAEMLSRLGRSGYIINISRGTVIDQRALLAALSEGTIAGAGLDVYETEPHSPDALTALQNVVLTPHTGSDTIEAHEAMQGCVIANLDAFYAGLPLPYGVN